MAFSSHSIGHHLLAPADDSRRLANWFYADNQLRAAWHQIRGQHPSRRLRLRLDENAPELHLIPWELLTDLSGEGGEMTLAAATATPFSRYLAGQWRPGSPILSRPIKVAVALANPTNLESDYGLQAIDIDTEMAQLAALTEALESGAHPAAPAMHPFGH